MLSSLFGSIGRVHNACTLMLMTFGRFMVRLYVFTVPYTVAGQNVFFFGGGGRQSET